MGPSKRTQEEGNAIPFNIEEQGKDGFLSLVSATTERPFSIPTCIPYKSADPKKIREKKNIRILEIKEILREEGDEEMGIVIPHTEERVSEGIAEEPGKEKEAAIEKREEKEETEEIGH